MFDHVKGKIVKPAKAPDRDAKQDGHFDFGMLQNQQRAGNQPDQQKKNALEFNPARVSQVFHRSKETGFGRDSKPKRDGV
jgi:hypothetical protein